MHAAHDGGAGNAARSLSCGLSSREEGEGKGRGKEEDVAENGSLFFFFFSFPESIDLIRGLEKWIEGALHRKLAVDERRNRTIEIGCVYIYTYEVNVASVIIQRNYQGIDTSEPSSSIFL